MSSTHKQPGEQSKPAAGRLRAQAACLGALTPLLLSFKDFRYGNEREARRAQGMPEAVEAALDKLCLRAASHMLTTLHVLADAAGGGAAGGEVAASPQPAAGRLVEACGEALVAALAGPSLSEEGAVLVVMNRIDSVRLPD